MGNGREDFACRSAVLPTLSEGLEIELSDFEAEDGMLKGDYFWQVVEILFGGVPTILKVRCRCLFMSLFRILLEGSLSRNLFDPLRHQVDITKVEDGIELLGNIHLATDINPRGIHFSPLLRWRPSFKI